MLSASNYACRELVSVNFSMQLPCGHEFSAPSGCLEPYTSTASHHLTCFGHIMAVKYTALERLIGAPQWSRGYCTSGIVLWGAQIAIAVALFYNTAFNSPADSSAYWGPPGMALCTVIASKMTWVSYKRLLEINRTNAGSH